MIVLGIETSCDETSAAIIKDGFVLSNIVHSQTVHSKYGGVVPDLASKNHEKNIFQIVKKAISDSGIFLNDIDGIAVTSHPGLLSSLIVGLNFAKGLSLSLKKPILGINHLEGHLSSNIINNNNIEFPYLCLIVSGGHTQIWLVKRHNEYKIISDTVDDAAGEAFDKGARILGLGYPGGPEIQKKSEGGDPHKYLFTIPNIKKKPFDFSFSGLKTALLYTKKKLDEKNTKYKINDLAASYQEVIIDTLIDKIKKVSKLHNIYNVSIAGGVSSNLRFRQKIKMLENYNVYFPDNDYCTDNAAMIAMCGFIKFKNKEISNIDILPKPNIIL